MNESELIVNIQRGDRNAFEKIFELYGSKAVRTAFLITGSQAAAEDVAQEAFVKCYYEIGSLKNPECFKTWFYKLLIRAAWKQARLEKRSVPMPDPEIRENPGREDSCEQQYLRQETSEMLYRQIQKLDQKKRTTVMLYYYSGLSIKEIAAAMDCLEGTVKSRLYFARKTLKSNLEHLQIKEEGYYGKAEYEPGR